MLYLQLHPDGVRVNKGNLTLENTEAGEVFKLSSIELISFAFSFVISPLGSSLLFNPLIRVVK